MDYSRLKERFGIDFVKVQFQTTWKTNTQTIHPIVESILGQSVFVHLLDKGDGGAGSIFAFNMQDPVCAGQVIGVIDRLKSRISLAEEPTITAIELSLDLEPRKGVNMTRVQIAGVVADLYNLRAWHPDTDNHRIYGEGRGSPQPVPAHRDSLVRLLADPETGFSIGIGNQRRGRWGDVDLVASRAYVKETRARIENTYQTERRADGSYAPLMTIAELRDLDFDQYRQHFTFRKFRDDLDPLLRLLVADRIKADYNAQERPRRNGGGTRKHHPATVADRALNAAVARAFKRLKNQWRKPYTCGNSDEFGVLDRSVTEESSMTTRDECAPVGNGSYNYHSPHLPPVLPLLHVLPVPVRTSTSERSAYTIIDQGEGEARGEDVAGALRIPLSRSCAQSQCDHSIIGFSETVGYYSPQAP